MDEIFHFSQENRTAGYNRFHVFAIDRKRFVQNDHPQGLQQNTITRSFQDHCNEVHGINVLAK